MQVREKGTGQFFDGQPLYAGTVRGSRAADDARPAVNDVGTPVDDDSYRRS
jgi:hypothetical protein